MDSIDTDVGFLVVGVGSLGEQRAAAASIARGCRLVAVTDQDQALARNIARRHGVVAAPSLAAALDSDEVGAVIVSTPHDDHAGSIRSALEAGKHVLCEKPLTVRSDDARSLAREADSRKVRLATGLNHRFYPPVRDALRLAADGAIGRVRSVRAEIGHLASAAFLKGWHADVVRSGGGTLMDNGPHACDLIRLFLGEVVSAEGRVGNTLGLPVGCESEAVASFTTDDQGSAELRSSWTLQTGYLTLDVEGEEGRLRVETAPWRLVGDLKNGGRVRRRYLVDRIAERLHRRRFGCERSLVRELEAFVTPGGHPRPGATGWDGCRATEMVQAVYESATTGRAVALSPLPLAHRHATRQTRRRASS